MLSITKIKEDMSPDFIAKYWAVIAAGVAVIIGYTKLQGRVDSHHKRLIDLEDKTELHSETLSDIRVFMENINVNMENIKRFMERATK